MTFNQVDSYRRMRSATEFSDVTLACEDGRQIYAHRVILASSSSFFQEVLTKVMHSHPLIYLKGVPHAHLSAIVDLIYLGQAEVVQKDLTLFLEIGRELGVKGLTEQGKGGEKASEEQVTKDVEKLVTKESYGDLPSYSMAVKGNILATTSTTHVDETNPLKFKCDECGKAYGTKTSLRAHKSQHNMENHKRSKVSSHEKKGEELGANGGEGRDANMLESNQNIATEESEGGLHLSSMAVGSNISAFETDQLVQNPLDLAAHKCDLCGKTYSTKASLSTHKWLHKKKLKSSVEISQIEKGSQLLGARDGKRDDVDISEQNGNTVMEVENENIPPKEGHLEQILTDVEDIMEREAEYNGSPVSSKGRERQGRLMKDRSE